MSQQAADTEIKQGIKRTASDLDTNDRPLKRAKTDSDKTSASGFLALSKDTLTEISYLLDFTDINAMFSASKSLRNHISWKASETQDFWAKLVLKKHPGFELKLAEGDEGPLPWRDVFIGTERKLTAGTKHLQTHLAKISGNPDLSEAERLDQTRSILAKLEFRQTLLEQVNSFLAQNPTMRNFWESRVMYTQHKVLAGLEWSVENYKWDVTNTAPVNITIIGKNGEALFLKALTVYFACYWGYGLHALLKHEVMPVREVSSAMEVDYLIDKKLFPKTPYEDTNDDAIIKNLVDKEEFTPFDKMTTEDWKKVLDEIGCADVDPELFAKLILHAVFPKGASYSTETTGYYTPSEKYVARMEKLPGVGGTVSWGKMRK